MCSDDVDNDCDGAINEADDAVDATIWYVDEDSDGFGDDDSAVVACDRPDDTSTGAVYTDVGGDCDDNSNVVNPEGTELCNGEDDDCDSVVDEDDAADAQQWFADDDDDGFGDAASIHDACTQPDGYSDNPDDCDDQDSEVHPDATEVCPDGLDNDCDGIVDACYSEVSRSAATEVGQYPDDHVGDFIVAAGDRDGDGNADLMIGARSADQSPTSSTGRNRGQVYLVTNHLGTTYLGDGVYGRENDLLGTAVAAGGDLDGDGMPDAAYVATGHDRSESAGDNTGAVFIHTSPDTYGPVWLDYDGLRWAPDGEEYVDATSIPGDTNGDSLADLVVSTDAAAYLLLGPITGDDDIDTDADAVFDDVRSQGTQVDIDGDGLSDLAATDLSSGEVVFFHGPLYGAFVAADADQRLSAATGSELGSLYSTGADITGDGLGDVLVGSRSTSTGLYALRVVDPSMLSSSLTSVDAVTASTLESDSRAEAADGCDLDGDGVAELIIGIASDDGSGSTVRSVRLVYDVPIGAEDLNAATGQIIARSASSDYLGFAETVVCVGDTDGDGTNEFAVGAPYVRNYRWSSSGYTYANAGAVYLYSAADLSVVGPSFPSGYIP